MKKYLVLLVPLVMVACSSYNPDDSYYGYDNNPTIKKDNDAVFDDNNWSNPLANNNSQTEVIRKENVNRNDYSGPVYVPVIVPWWNSYYGWGASPRRRGGVYVHYSNYWGPEWYSPWYSYHPYHGVTWYDYWYVRPHYRHWYNQPVYSYYDRPIRRSEARRYGNSRGTYSVYNPRGSSRSARNTRDYNPRSARYTSSGENIYRRGDNYRVTPRGSSNRNVYTPSSSRQTNTYSQPSRSSGSSRGASGSSGYSQPSNSRNSGSSASPSRESRGSRSSGSSSRGSRGSSRSSGGSRGR